MPERTQIRSAAAAKSVSQRDRLNVVPEVEFSKGGLKPRPEVIRIIVQAHLEKASFDDMIRVIAVKGDLALENSTCEKGDSGGVSSLIRFVFPLHNVDERESITGGLVSVLFPK